VETYVKAFEDLGVPLAATRAGFYDSLEVRDLISLLTILDNPLQDVPLLGVLMSPLAGLTAEELAAIRLARRPGHYWLALVHWHQQAARSGGAASPFEKSLLEKASRFLDLFHSWRRLARQRPVSYCLEVVLDQTHYSEWLGAQKRGGQRRANVEQLLQLTRQFDTDRGEGLYRFLRFVEAQQKNEVDIEPAGAPLSDAVRLMSIHQSKGLEFPIVVLPDLAKKFNLQDTHGRVILDEHLGLCPQVKPPGGRRFYPSLAHWLAARRQKRETYGEEMRLLYVAATRACERLILCGAISKKTVPELWPDLAATEKGAARVLAAGSYLDWIGTWLATTNEPAALDANGQSPLLRWIYYDEQSHDFPSSAPPAECQPRDAAATPVAPVDFRRIRDRLEWGYSFQPATQLPAKTAVSGLRRQMAPADDEESEPLFSLEPLFLPGRAKSEAGQLSAAEAGSAHHAFLEMAKLDRLSTVAGLSEEAARLCSQKLLSADQIACLDFEALAAFWQSDIGAQFLSQAEYLRRELAFTARFSCSELSRLGAANFADAGEKEFVVVQGIIDLAAVLPREIWLLDFKTDRFPPAHQAARVDTYRPQLALYAAAAARIYSRPVTRCWLHFLTARQTVEVAAP
jgi:ATP-dependent helicase/nuclease subunit A